MSGNKYGKWKSEPLEEFFKKFPKPTLRMRLYRLGLKLKRKHDQSSKTQIRGYRGYVGSGHIPHHQSSSNSNTTFKESYQFDPERAYIERIQERAYMDMVDGKGDPQPCDCHDDR